MRGRPQRGAEGKQPRESLNTSSIQKYLKETNQGSPKNPAHDNNQQSGKEKKKEKAKSQGANGGSIRGESGTPNMMEDPSMESPLTKIELLEMFAKLEVVIKTEIHNVRTDMGHLLKRVESAEEASDKQSREIIILKQQVKDLQLAQRDKLEAQENQNRRQNLRLRALPEQRDEDLHAKMKAIFNPILGRNPDDELKIDRVHRLRKPPNVSEDKPRDIIIRFHHYEDKAKVWSNLRKAQPVKFEGVEIQCFADISAETLAWRRQLRPLLEELRKANMKYSWGFPTSLIVVKAGRTSRLKHIDNMQDFCNDLNIPVPTIFK